MSGSYAAGTVFGPLSTSKTPLIMQPHNSGVLYGYHPNPPQFYPASGSNDYANSRNVYARAFSRFARDANDIPSSNMFIPGLNKTVHTTQATSYVAPKTSYDHMLKLKAINVGKSSFKQTLPDSAPLSFKSPDPNATKSRLRMVRSGGTVAPRKKYRNYF